MIEKAEFSQQENKSGCAPRGTKWDSQRLGATEVSWPAERTGRHVVSQVESGGTSFSHGLFIFLFCCCCLVTQSCPILCDSMDGNHQAPLSMGFLRPEHWSGLPFPSPGVFLTQISNQHRMFGRRILYHWTIWEAHFSVSTPCIPFKSVVKSLPISLWEFREWRKMFFF